MLKRTLCFILLLSTCSLIAQDDRHFQFAVKDTSRTYVRLLFAGDAMQHSTQYNWAYNAHTKQYEYEANFRYILPYIQESDINLVNFEATIGTPGHYSGYPFFRCPENWLNALAEAGFQVFALANNHMLDGGKSGLMRTLQKMSPYPHCGAYADTTQRRKEYPLLLEIDGIRIELFNCTYGTNGLTPVAPTRINYIETEEIQMDMERSMQDTTIDLRIFFIHWGTEYQLHHNAIQEGTAQWLADLGADLIIGSHPHVVQDMEIRTAQDGRRVPVVYSLGNFLSNQRWENSNGGILATVDISRATHRITAVDYVPFYVHKGYLNNQKDYYCIPTLDYTIGILPFRLPSDSLQQDLKSFHTATIKRLGAALHP